VGAATAASAPRRVGERVLVGPRSVLVLRAPRAAAPAGPG